MLEWPFDPARHALFLDLDGTVIDIAATPTSVSVPRALAAVMARARRRLDGALAVLSGRPIADIDRLLAPERFPAAGVHGAELRAEAEGEVHRLAGPLPDDLIVRIASLAQVPGVLVENKGLAIAVHYRNAEPEAGIAIRECLVAMIEAAEEWDLTLLLGKCVAEVKPRRLGKGSAVATFMEQPSFRSRLPVVIGDDVTDEAAFEMAGRFGGFGVAVGFHRPGASYVASSPEMVRSWLAWLAEGQ